MKDHFSWSLHLNSFAFIPSLQRACIISMACIHIDGHEVPLVFPIHDGGRARVLCHLLHVHFKLVESSIYIKEEKKSKSREL